MESASFYGCAAFRQYADGDSLSTPLAVSAAPGAQAGGGLGCAARDPGRMGDVGLCPPFVEPELARRADGGDCLRIGGLCRGPGGAHQPA